MDIFVFVSEQWLLVSALLVLIYLLAISESKKGGQQLAISEAVTLINADTAVVLDIRDKKEFNVGRIHGAINIPNSSLTARKSELEKYQTKTIIIVDKVGTQSGQAGKLLSASGFDVRRLKGGMSEWQSQNLPLVTGKGNG